MKDDGLLVIGAVLYLEDQSNFSRQNTRYSLDINLKKDTTRVTDKRVNYTKHDVYYYFGECYGECKLHLCVWRAWTSLNKTFP